MKQKIIIFEGPDKVGKTEIAKEYASRLGLKYFKNGDEGKNFLDSNSYYVNLLRYADPYFLSYLKQTETSIVLDRHFPSEWVYSIAFKRKTDMDALTRTDEMLADMGAQIVICYRLSYQGREDDLFPDKINSSMLENLHNLYITFSEWTKCHVHFLNVDDEDLNREVLDVIAGTI